ncbi:MAG: hypothetical protein JO292_00655 [Betaproteobacteria bacterium]|nr:hypothetical protein [Betaproteobacteria bacterium]MBV9359873.1 hypothetical protein [Betaproteobacteria bacterium]
MNSLTRIAMALAVFLAACATAQDVENAKSSWMGASYEDVLRAWGAPARSTNTADGRYWYTWETVSAVQPGSSVGFSLGGVRLGGGGATGVGVGTSVPVGSPPPPESCQRTLIFQNGVVVDQSWQGPPSMCADFKRH